MINQYNETTVLNTAHVGLSENSVPLNLLHDLYVSLWKKHGYNCGFHHFSNGLISIGNILISKYDIYIVGIADIYDGKLMSWMGQNLGLGGPEILTHSHVRWS